MASCSEHPPVPVPAIFFRVVVTLIVAPIAIGLTALVAAAPGAEDVPAERDLAAAELSAEADRAAPTLDLVGVSDPSAPSVFDTPLRAPFPRGAPTAAVPPSAAMAGP